MIQERLADHEIAGILSGESGYVDAVAGLSDEGDENAQVGVADEEVVQACEAVSVEAIRVVVDCSGDLTERHREQQLPEFSLDFGGLRLAVPSVQAR